MTLHDDNIRKIEQSMTQFKEAINGLTKRSLLDPTFSKTQYEIISSISDTPFQTASSLAARLHVTSSSITQTVDTLVRRDLVCRVPSEDDRRVVHLELTEAGNSYARAARAAQHSWMAELISHLTNDEVKKTLDAFETLQALMATPAAKQSTKKESTT